MKKETISKLTLILFVTLVSFLILAPMFVSAAGLVPCGLSENDPKTSWDETADCDLCGFLWLIKNVMDLIFKLAGAIFLLFIVIGAILFLVAGGSENLVTTGKKMFFSAVIGLAIIFSSWLIISAVLGATGYNATDNWYKFECEMSEQPIPTYFTCENGACVEKEGEGSDTCGGDEDCYRFVCSEGMCQKENTPGTNECSNLTYSCLPECNNGIDDDGDQKIDYPADPGCTGPGDNNETEAPSILECIDGKDNDGDGKIDFGGSLNNDPGCQSFLDNSETNPNIQCDNGLDDDNDGKIDYRPVPGVGDPGCENLLDNDESDESNCNDGIDNDNDGWIDMADPGCQVDPSSESNPNIQCDNGFDDDGDTKIDFKIDGSGDPQCTSPLDNDEANGTGIPACQDGIDNDGDGTADFNGVSGTYPPDPGCISFNDTSEKQSNGPQCDDGVNNDDPQDNLIDYKVDGSGDPQCTGPEDNDEWNGVVEGKPCDQCGEGLFNICDVSECHGLLGTEANGCHFKNGWIPHYCYECVGGDYPVNSCSDYLSQESCEFDACGIDACSWEEGSCVEVVVDPFEGYTLQVDERQKDHASQALMDLLASMKDKLPEEARVISSISDDNILSDECDYLNCSGNVCGGCSDCAHGCNSCHYGGKNCNTQERFSYAVDFAKEDYCGQIKTAALECNAGAFVNYEGTHVHVSVGRVSGCGCDTGTGTSCP